MKGDMWAQAQTGRAARGEEGRDGGGVSAAEGAKGCQKITKN